MKKMKLFAALLLGTALVASGCGNTKSEETPTQPDASTKAESPAQAEEPAPADEPEEEAADTETEAPEELSGELTYWSIWNDTEPQGEAWQEIINGFMDK